MRHWASVIFGTLTGVTCLISLWTTLGQGSLLRRTFFLACSAIALLAAWGLGLIAYFPTESVNPFGREEFYFTGLLPTIFAALCLPLIGLRWFGFALAKQHYDVPAKQPITTTSLMTLTVLVACCLSGVRLAMMSGDVDITFPLVFCSGCSLVIGLAVVLPAVLLLCSSRKNYLIWSLVFCLIASLILAGICIGILVINGATPSTYDALKFFEGSLAATITFSIGIGIVRLFGYRLEKEASRQSAQPKSELS